MTTRSLIAAALVAGLGVSSAWAGESALLNPTRRDYQNEVARLKETAPGPAGTFVVTEDGVEVPYQVEKIDGKDYVWVCANFAPGASHKYAITPGKPQTFPTKVTVKQEGDSYLLDNGQTAIKLPATAKAGLPGPVTAIKLADGKWVGGSSWTTPLKLKAFSATVVDDGTVLGKVRLRYDFDGKAGLNQDIPAFAEVDVTLAPGWQHAAIFERHEMPRGSYWEFAASEGWKPTQGQSKRFSGGFNPNPPPADRELKPVVNVSLRPDMYINLFPRWNQHFKDGWYFGATDGAGTVGAIVVRAGQWVWPHENAIEGIVKESGDYAGFRCPTWKGQRLWWLAAGATVPANPEYLMHYGFECLDKLNQDFILEWPGMTKGGWYSRFPYDGSINPTGGIRGEGKGAINGAGSAGDLSSLYRMQVMIHPDTYGTYWNYWSPENPNFFTDLNKIPIALATTLRDHPQFETLRKMAEMRFREDLYHSITLPGGAGQECPGYMYYALEENLVPLAQACAKYLGFDPREWDRFKAGQHFLWRITQPDGAGVRVFNHAGDTHPGGHWQLKPHDPKWADEVKDWKTEELPGFGVIFNNKPGTDQETYLSFKAGPNRGHYHGDQLAFHYCANAHRVAVDHHCSYGPRSGQEHMHNRVAFFTDEFPYANMDGYERVIGMKTSTNVDVAIGQVESERLRKVKQYPAEDWDTRYPQLAFDKPLVYRRTMVLVKNGVQDYFVIRDQYQADRPLNAAFCLHADPSTAQGMENNEVMEHQGNTVTFYKTDGATARTPVLSLVCAEPFSFAELNWSHTNGGLESTLGARLEVKGKAAGEFITVMYPGAAPAVTVIPGGVKVGNDEITFGGGLDEQAGTNYVTVKRGGKVELNMTGKEIDLNRSQGEIGLFVPDAGYPFGEIPDWLAKQRAARPDWAKQ